MPFAGSYVGRMSKRSERFKSLSTPARGLSGVVQRAARASARRPKTAIALWFVLIVGLVAAGSMTGTREMTSVEASTGESGDAARVLADAHLGDPAVESVLVSADESADAGAAAAKLSARLERLPAVASVSHPGAPDLVADGGRARLVQVSLRGDPEHAGGEARSVSNAVDRFAEREPGVSFEQTGTASLEKAVDRVVEDDLGRAEMFSLPLILAILLVAFGAAVAAAVPVILGITAVAGALGAAGLVSQIAPDSGSTAALVVLIGLAVGVDYSLFYIRREREERRLGKGPVAALDAAAATVGRAVVVSGLTVIVALAGLLVTGLGVFASMALGTMVVVLMAVIGSITVLPAVLTLLGDRIDRGRIPLLRRRAGGGGGIWGRLAGVVSARPAASLIASLCVLGSLAVPAVDLHLGESTTADLPDDIPAVAALRHIEASFPGAPADARVVVEGHDLDSPAGRVRLKRLGERALGVTGGSGAVAVRVAGDGRTALVSVPMPDMSRDDATATVDALRSEVGGKAAVGTVLIGGDAADSADFTDAIRGAMPLVVGIVLALAFVLLVAAFGSPWLGLAVIALNLLSVGAAYGVLTVVFQHGWGESLLGFSSNGTVVTWVPLFAFVILFGLSMDYTVLVLERIREARRAGLAPAEAVREGVAATAGAVTSAAVVMVAVFSLFAMLRLPEMKQLGVGLGAAILIDATIVRGVALPAAVTLLGERRWRVRPLRGRRAIIARGGDTALRTDP
ncbi:MAG: membrane protein [Actinomycetes bacterium]|nr:MAG: membrane protein [Actinomycetes bacterium]